MGKTFKYRKKLLNFLESDNDFTAMFDWIAQHSELIQMDILRVLSSIVKECFENTEDEDYLEKTKILDKMIDKYEQSILDEKLHKSLFMKEMEARITDEETFGYFIDFVRQDIITRVVSDPENQENWDFVTKAIQIEKKSGFYNPDNWKAII